MYHFRLILEFFNYLNLTQRRQIIIQTLIYNFNSGIPEPGVPGVPIIGRSFNPIPSMRVRCCPPQSLLLEPPNLFTFRHACKFIAFFTSHLTINNSNRNLYPEFQTSLIMSEPIRVVVTGAAGQIGYSLLYMISSGYVFGPEQPVILHLLDIAPMMGVLGGVAMEIDDCAFPLVKGEFL